jgi:hypothetical protein
VVLVIGSHEFDGSQRLASCRNVPGSGLICLVVIYRLVCPLSSSLLAFQDGRFLQGFKWFHSSRLRAQMDTLDNGYSIELTEHYYLGDIFVASRIKQLTRTN